MKDSEVPTSFSNLKHIRLIKIIALVILATLQAIGPTHAEELPYSKRIFLSKDSINPEEKTRVMLYTSKFSIYPQFNQGAMFIQPPVVQGVDPISSLVGALIGVAIVNETNKSERDAAVAFNNQLNEALASIDISNELKLAVQAELAKNDQFKTLEFESVDHINELAQPGLLIRIEEKSILTLLTRVHFDAQLKSLCVETSSKIWRKNEARPIYFSDLSYSSAYLPESNKADLKKRWVSDSGALLKEKIKEGIAEISHMLANDLSQNHAIETDSANPMLIETLSTNTNKKITTTLYKVEEMPDRLIGRLGSPDSSLLSSIPKANLSAKSAQ